MINERELSRTPITCGGLLTWAAGVKQELAGTEGGGCTHEELKDAAPLMARLYGIPLQQRNKQ
jgi:hypothetical protein